MRIDGKLMAVSLVKRMSEPTWRFDVRLNELSKALGSYSTRARFNDRMQVTALTLKTELSNQSL